MPVQTPACCRVGRGSRVGDPPAARQRGPPLRAGAQPLMEQISWCEEDNHFPTISPNDWELDLSALEVSSLRSTMHRLMLQSPYRHLRARAFGNDMLCLRVTLALAGCCACRLDAWLLWQ